MWWARHGGIAPHEIVMGLSLVKVAMQHETHKSSRNGVLKTTGKGVISRVETDVVRHGNKRM